MNDVGANIQKLRLNRGISQNKLAKLSGVSQSAISAIESTTKSPSVDTIFLLAQALGAPVTALLFGDESGETPSEGSLLSPDEQKLIQDYRSLNKQGQEYIRQTMFMALPIYIRHSDFSDLEEMKQG